ncbi:filamentous hemagglutinin, partial [Pseudomonas sp. NFPP09]
GWSVSGWDYQKDREQIVRATVGAGEIVVRKDAETGADSTAGLNRDVSKAYEITKDEESRTDLYASSSSLGAVASPKKTYEQWKKSVELYGEKSRETMVKLTLLLASMGVLIASPDNLQGTSEEINRVLIETENYLKAFSKDENRRAEAIEFRLKQKFGDPKSDGEKLLVARMQEIARQSPEKSVELTALIGRLSDSPAGANNYAQGLASSGVMLALVGALAYQASTPENQARMRNAANSMIESVSRGVSETKEQVQSRLRVSMGLWELVTHMPFPIHLLDDENRKLVSPIVDTSGGIPASGGYAEGGGVVTTPHTGGTQLDGVQKDGAYVTPEHKLNPGVMYSEDGAAKGLIGQDFENYLYKELGGKPSFSTKGREFDGAYGANNSIWYEAKSGRYWEDHAQAGSKGFDKFKSDVGAHARIAKDNGASFEVHSNTPIPQHAKEWLSSKGIFFKEY